MRSNKKTTTPADLQHALLYILICLHTGKLQVKCKTTLRGDYTLSVSEELDACYMYPEYDISLTITNNISQRQCQISVDPQLHRT